jgi:L-serine/L-threonine ammonia-lyase
MVDLLEAAGANVIVYGESISDAGNYMRDVVMPGLGTAGNVGGEIVGIELHPFDDERIWEGVSTIVDELAYQLPARDNEDITHPSPLPVDAIVCSVGGGGLMNGIILGIERQSLMTGKPRGPSHKQKDIHILATETHGTASLALAVTEKCLASLPAITSLATSLGAVRVAHRTLQNTLSPPRGIKVHSVVLHDAEAARGVLRLVDEQKLLVELACGVCVEAAIGVANGAQSMNKLKKTLHRTTENGSVPTANEPAQEDVDTDVPVFSRLAQLIPGFCRKSRVVIIVCGGNNVTVDMAAEWRRRIDDGWGIEEISGGESEGELGGEEKGIIL